ncbi:hypothetical protein [Novacetimonas sp. GS1]|uniref:hypothetical protein n=1 Tax=Novacetimonas sp. GS1 TaxID=3119990 RepID=UPI002FCCBDEC
MKGKYLPTYKNIDGDSSIVSYAYDATSIEVIFGKGKQTTYIYTYGSAGMDHVERMKILADSGRGLNEYIRRYVNYKYASKS